MTINKMKVDLLLTERNLKREDLACLYGCSKNRISAMLNSRTVRASTANKLAKALGVDVLDIIVTENQQ